MKYQSLIVIVSLLFTANSWAACLATTAEALAPNQRFIVRNSVTEVFDQNTNLVWKRCPEGLSGTKCLTGTITSHDWKSAIELGDSEWRLPNVKELASLIEPQCVNPAINNASFPENGAAEYWTSSPDRNQATKAWSVDFNSGSVGSILKDQQKKVRLVKDN